MRAKKAIVLSLLGLSFALSTAITFLRIRIAPETAQSRPKIPVPTSVHPSPPVHVGQEAGKTLTFGLGGGSPKEHKKTRAEITKDDCERLEQGQLLFNPSSTMRVGQPYIVSARLSRIPTVNIAEGLLGSTFTIVTETVSCKVSVNLDSQEPAAFSLEKIPEGRKDEQILEPKSFSQWDWRVTPKKPGKLHLLLYVTPMLYVDGIGEQLKQFSQPPKVITVSPDYLYAFKAFVKDDWTTLSGLLTAVVIPLFLWFRTGIVSWFKRHFGKDKASQT